jgi:hypothetical protein
MAGSLVEHDNCDATSNDYSNGGRRAFGNSLQIARRTHRDASCIYVPIMQDGKA